MLRIPLLVAHQAADRAEHGQETKACGHAVHIGTCACCQRSQLDRWRAQLAQARADR